MRFWFLMATGWIVFALNADDAKPAPQPARERALAAWKAGNVTNAIALISEGISAEPKDPRLWNFRAQMRSLRGDYSGAVTDLTEALRLLPDSAGLYEERGMTRFKFGQIPEAMTDFDRANELDPQFVPYNWQRGIALYYVKRFAEGKTQFERHREVNANDVENAVWHFACVAKAEGLEAAKKQLIDVPSDARIPMVEIHDLFAGTGDAEDVLEAARDATGDAQEKRTAHFYAYLYLGLYYDLHGQTDQAVEALKKAVTLAAPDDYMGHVARVHLKSLSAPSASPVKP